MSKLMRVISIEEFEALERRKTFFFYAKDRNFVKKNQGKLVKVHNSGCCVFMGRFVLTNLNKKGLPEVLFEELT